MNKLAAGVLVLLLVHGAEAVRAETIEIILQPSELIIRGNRHIEHGEIDAARAVFLRALNSSLTISQQANAHNGLCVAGIKEENWQDAMKHCDQAIDLAPHNWRYHNNRGNVHLGLGQYQKAMIDYEKGLRFAPKSSTIKKNMALTQTRAGKNDLLDSSDPGRQ